MSTTLDCLINIASEKFDVMEEDDPKKVTRNNSFSDMIYSPVTPKSVLPEPMSPAYSSVIPLWSLRAVGNLNPIDLKRLSYHMSPPRLQTHETEKEPTINMEIIDQKVENPARSLSQDIVLHSDATTDHGETYDNPQATEDVEKLSASPPLSSSLALVPPPPPAKPFKIGPAPAPPPPSMPRGSGAAAPPPPPPPGAGRSLRPKATTKLKRSTQLGNLYRTLKGKVEGSSIKGKSSGGRTNAIGAGTSGKQGMAEALAEMTKRYNFLDTA